MFEFKQLEKHIKMLASFVETNISKLNLRYGDPDDLQLDDEGDEVQCIAFDLLSVVL